ncbi:MAG: copper amine oxidase N-terminal domain-containing protein [Clostridiales bacterium]
MKRFFILILTAFLLLPVLPVLAYLPTSFDTLEGAMAEAARRMEPKELLWSDAIKVEPPEGVITETGYMIQPVGETYKKAVDNIVIIRGNPDSGFTVTDYLSGSSVHLSWADSFQDPNYMWNDLEFEQAIHTSMKGSFTYIHGLFALYINNVPWQESPWADLIKEGVNQNPGLLADPFTRAVWEDSEYTLHIRSILNPHTDEERARREAAMVKLGFKEPEELSAPPEVTPVKQKQVKLTLGSNKIIVIEDNATTGQSFLSVPATLINGSTMIPLRGVVEEFGAELNYDEASKTVTILRGEGEVKLTIGQASAMVNGEKITLSAAPIIQEGRTLLPLRGVLQALGLTVDYDGATKEIRISN